MIKVITDKEQKTYNSFDEVSDGYHTFKELYDYRAIYNALWFNELSKNPSFNVHKSWKHSDGEPCFGGGWFVVVADLPTGQITNHYEASIWDMFKIPERDRAADWDGHTPKEAYERMKKFINQ